MLVNNTLEAIEMGMYSKECAIPIESTQKDNQIWEKESIEYAIKNKEKLIKFIRHLGKSTSKQIISYYDAEDIWTMLTDQLFKSPDYDISIASERSKTGEIVSLEGYVHYQAKCCFSRFNTETYKRNKDIAKDYINDDEGKELSPLDTIEDINSSLNFEEVIYDIETSCRQYQCYRYKYGIDLYMLLYIRLLTALEGKSKTVYMDILETLGISRKELLAAEIKSRSEEVLRNLISAIANTEHTRAIRIIEKYVYSANKIKEFALQYC